MTDTRINEALDALDIAITHVYNIDGDRWQLAYELLEVIVSNLKIDKETT